MPGGGEEVNAQGLDIDGEEAGALGGIDQKRDAPATAPGTEFGNRLHGPGDVGTVGQNHQGRRLGTGPPNVLGGNVAARVGGDLDHRHPAFLQHP